MISMMSAVHVAFMRGSAPHKLHLPHGVRWASALKFGE